MIVPNNKWVFVILVVEPTKATIYMDGEKFVNTATYYAEEFDGVTNVGEDPYSIRHFKGKIADVKIYPISLTATQIQKMYYDNIIPTGSVLDLDFDNIAGSTIPDKSGNSNDGTITGATESTDSPSKARTLASGRVLIT